MRKRDILSLAVVVGFAMAMWGGVTLAVEAWFGIGAEVAAAPIMVLPMAVMAWQMWTARIEDDDFDQAMREMRSATDDMLGRSPERRALARRHDRADRAH